VAVARALAVEPPVLLMDEPLSNLDALLRLEMRAELKTVLQHAGTTTIYVTHDQTEAMGLADRIAVMHGGKIVQIDTPTEIYRHPKTKFVGGFVGSPPMNFFPVEVKGGQARLGGMAIPVSAGDGPLLAGVRPEDFAIVEPAQGIAAEILVVEPLGSHTLLTARCDGNSIRIVAPDIVDWPAGRRIGLVPTAGRVVDGPHGRNSFGTKGMTDLIDAAQAILRANDRGGYTVPTDRLYPFQWNWDSAFVALGWATFDKDRAWREIERLLEGQWDDGMVPHIVFHVPSDDYFPGPDVWGTTHRPATSGVTQPPVLATVVRRLFDVTGAAERAAALYPKLLAWHRWWAKARDPEGTGLVAILHPWESGMDNSPAWDLALARVPMSGITPIRRRDTHHIGADMRPQDEEYRRYIALVDLFRTLRWKPEAMWAHTPFKVADVGINAMLHRAETDLLALAGSFGKASDEAEITQRLERRRQAMPGLWNEAAGFFEPFDLIAQAPVPVATSAGFLPLFAGLVDIRQARRMAAEIERWAEVVRYLVPSLSPRDPRFDAKRYWRGPAWAIVNRMIAEGLADYGQNALATRIQEHTHALVRRGGFAEYFDPTTGEGLGGERFSWTAATALSWAAP